MEGVTYTTARRDLEGKTTPAMVIPNNTAATLTFDEITNATVELSGLEVQTTGGYVSLVYRLDLCQKMSPPPIPPWLMETPDKLRHLVANCSSWKKYTDLCSLHIPPEYPQALADGSNSGSHVVQWIPFIIVLLVVTFIVVSVAVMYTLYRSNRMKCDIFSDYQKHENFPHNYCLPHGSLTSSVTIETQLSVCALEDDSFASMPPLHLAYEDIAQSHRTQTAPPQSSSEIILHPASLEDADMQSHQFVSDRSMGDYYSSSHSLPIIPDKGTPQDQHQQANGSAGSDNEDSNSTYVLIHKRKLDTSSLAGSSHYLTVVNENKTALSKGKDTVRGMVKRCRRAGVYLVHGVFGNKANEGVGSTSGKPVTSLNKKLRSFHSFQLKKQRPFRKSKSLEHEIISSDISATVEPDMGLEVGNVHSLTNSNGTTGDNDSEKDHKVRTARRMLKIINPLQRSESKGAKKLVRKEIRTRQSAGDDCAYLNQVFEPNSGLKSNRSQFKGIKMTNIFKKFNKGKAS